MVKNKVYVPPLKIQGIKTKLVPLIQQYALLENDTIWIEPFMGSGVVGFNIAPKNAIFSDINPHIINFYSQIQDGIITPEKVRIFLEYEGKKLSESDANYYNYVRDRFNAEHNPLDFLFLNRSCFNGMMRFNKNNNFNVPYGHKPERFSKAYITKIVNQVAFVQSKIKLNNWTFICQSFDETISKANSNSFIYCDPPYIGRHVDYYDSWDEQSEFSLCKNLKSSHAKFIVSTWDHTYFRKNEYLDSFWDFCYKVTQEHFYHVGAKETNRHSVMEAILMNYQPLSRSSNPTESSERPSLFVEKSLEFCEV